MVPRLPVLLSYEPKFCVPIPKIFKLISQKFWLVHNLGGHGAQNLYTIPSALKKYSCTVQHFTHVQKKGDELGKVSTRFRRNFKKSRNSTTICRIMRISANIQFGAVRRCAGSCTRVSRNFLQRIKFRIFWQCRRTIKVTI